METLHMVINVRMDVKDGADTAYLTCNVFAQNCPPGREREPDGPSIWGRVSDGSCEGSGGRVVED